MTRCAIAMGAGMAALHLLPQMAGFASVPARGKADGFPATAQRPIRTV